MNKTEREKELVEINEQSQTTKDELIARKYGFTFTPKLIYLIESLKVEGWWSLKHPSLCIQNKNLPFLRQIATIVEDLGIPMHKRMLIKMKFPEQEAKKEEISLTMDSKLLNFHLENSPFDGSKKAVTSLPYKEGNIVLNVKGKIYAITLKAGEEEIEARSEIKAWAYCDLRFPAIRLLRFLSEFVGNKKELKIEPFLLRAGKTYVASAFSALIDTEGSIDHYGLFRKIRVRMRSPTYLKMWQELLGRFNVKARFQKNNEKEYEICIEGWEDLNRLKELGLSLYHSKRAKKFDSLMNSYKRHQISRGSAFEFYIQKLQDTGRPVTASEFATILGKSKRVVNHQLTKLMKSCMITIDKSNVAYLYSGK